MNPIDVLGKWLESMGITHVTHCHIKANWRDRTLRLAVLKLIIDENEVISLVRELKHFELKEIKYGTTSAS